jgi:hypothetical protein
MNIYSIAGRECPLAATQRNIFYQKSIIYRIANAAEVQESRILNSFETVKLLELDCI